MEVFVARQPIFNRRMDVTGYELLYRRGQNNFYEGLDDNKATAEVIHNAFFSMHFRELTNDTRAFINFPLDMLVQGIPLMLPKKSIVIEVLDRVEATPEAVSAIARLRENGYTIALDDYTFQPSYAPLVELADIIKVEFSLMDKEKQQQLLQKHKNRKQFVAEKVETREEYEMALKMGYDLFQGYFFSKPVIHSAKEVGSFNTALIQLIDELNRPEPDNRRIASIIETDVGLSYKILRLAGSIYYGSRKEIRSILNAVVRLGIEELKRWCYILLLKDVQVTENKEMIKTCLIRAKLMELFAFELDMHCQHMDFFMTGLFSAMDVLLKRPMGEIMEELPLSQKVKDALLGTDNNIRRALQIVRKNEISPRLEPEAAAHFADLTPKRYMRMYVESLKWVIQLDF